MEESKLQVFQRVSSEKYLELKGGNEWIYNEELGNLKRPRGIIRAVK
jgi:hypothetical protein